MDAERARGIIKKLAHVEETVQWGETLIFWVGDKAIGGKMFALIHFVDNARNAMSFSAGPERYAELLEQDGFVPAPYMAHIYWVAIEHWDDIGLRELTELLAAAHALTYAKLTQRTRDALALPAGPRRKLIEERRRELAARKAVEDEKKRVSALALKATKAAGKKVAAKGAQPRHDRAV